MVRVLLWKEWREQAAILIALIALGAGVIGVATALGEPPSASDPFMYAGYQDPPRLAAIMLALTAGVVVGGALFAGEQEAGTFEYLDGFPPPRRNVWVGKVAAGAILAAVASGLIVMAAAAVGALGGKADLAAWCVWVFALSLAVFAWGVCGSVLMKSTLAACGVGIAMSLPFVGLSLLAAALLVEAFGDAPPGIQSERAGLPAALFLVGASGLGLSAVLFTRPDRQRRAVYITPGVTGTARAVNRRYARRRSGFGFRSLLWLSFWQLLGPGIVLFVLAVVGGLALAFVDPAYAVWPGLSMFLAALTGVLAWGDERGGAYKFWAERRLPVGRLWLAKVTSGSALALGLILVLGLPNFLLNVLYDDRHIGAFFRAGFLGVETYYGPGTGIDPRHFFQYLLLWPVYGFAAGHLAGMLFKKAVVAVGVAVLSAGGLAALWFPSFFIGGILEWQVLPPPALAVLLAWWLGRAWTTERLGHRRAVAAFVVCGAAGLVSVGYALWYRIGEVPVVKEIDDDLRFAATLPNLEQNQSGRETKQAIEILTGLMSVIGTDAPDTPLFPDDAEPDYGFGRRAPYRDSVHAIIGRHGYPAGRPDFDRWLDAAFTRDWDKLVLAAESRPMGPVFDPSAQAFFETLGIFEGRSMIGPLLLVRGLREQARGNPQGFVRDLAAALAVGRNLRYKSAEWPYLMGRSYDAHAAAATARFLERHTGPAEALGPLAEVWAKHGALMAGLADETWLADRTTMRETAANPSRWAYKYFLLQMEVPARGRGVVSGAGERAKVEADLLGFAYAVPWEKERLRRVVGVGNNPLRSGECMELTRGGPVLYASIHRLGLNGPERALAESRAAVLRVAVRRFMAANGGVAPKSLDELVPKYLAAIPADPFDGKPFRYRVSAGETVYLHELPQKIFNNEFVPEPFPELSEQDATAHAALAGGFVRVAKPLPGPPGLDGPFGPIVGGGGPGGLGDDECDAVAALAGGVVQWPFQPLTKEARALGGLNPQDADPGNFARKRVVPPPPETRRTLNLHPGQPILWSVGPDGTDDGGTEQTRANGFRNSEVDLLYVVPLPPTAKEKK